MIYWIFFILAVVAEVTGTLTMKHAAISGGTFGLLFMCVMITLSYIFLGMAVKKIALGVAYALWEGIGGFFITIFSLTLFGEFMSSLKVAGLLTLLAGIVLVKSGSEKETISLPSHTEKRKE